MNINDLMIGDWVYNFHHRRPIQITAYDFFTHSHSTEDGTQSFIGILNPQPTLGRDLCPIQITDEFLMDNGFIQKNETEFEHTERRITYYCDYALLCLKGQKIPSVVTYVHQLQHALRLCGLNELANNLKVNYNEQHKFGIKEGDR